MKGNAVAFFAPATPLAFLLGFVFWFHSALSPGIVAFGRFPPSEPGDLRGGVFTFLVNGVSWLVLFVAGYARTCKRQMLIKAVGVPLCVVLALASRGLLFVHDPFFPEPILFWLFRGPISRGSSTDSTSSFLYSQMPSAGSSSSGLHISSYEWTARGSARAANKEAKHS